MNWCKTLILIVTAVLVGNLAGQKPTHAQAEPAFATEILLFHEVSYSGVRNSVLGRMRQGFQPLSVEIFVKALNGEVEIPWWNLRTFLITFDDGLASQYHEGLRALQSINQETGIFVPAVFFVMTKFDNLQTEFNEIGENVPSYRDGSHRYMTKGQLLELIAEGFWVDNHTIDHANLPSLSIGARNAQVEDGQARINALWKLAGRDKPYKLFAYPNGNYFGQVDYIRDLGYDAAFSTIKTNWHTTSNRYRLGRF